MPVSPARVAAFDVLLRVEHGSYASELLHSATYERLSAPDHALATELVMGVLRWRSRLDDEISTASSQPLSKLDVEVLIALRLALYQLRWLDRIPQHAALHESVELVKRARKRSAVPFANAVLRKLSAIAKNRTSAADDSSIAGLAQSFAHPLWLVDRWVNEYGFPAARAICEYDQSVPATAIRLRSPSAAAELLGEGIELAPGSLLASSRRVVRGDITKLQDLSTGRLVVIQDEASQLVAAIVGRFAGKSKKDLKVLDCCAAPGGKTLAIADANPSASILAAEIHPHRARLLQRLVTVANPSGRIRTIVADACQLPTACLFDRVLADVPCSGTGTLARNPEIKWRLGLNDLADLHARQSAILHSAIAQVAPGGRVVYSTCSLEKEENEIVIEGALADNNSISLVDCRIELERLKAEGELVWPDVATLSRGPYLRTIPGIHPCDGFFAAILEKI